MKKPALAALLLFPLVTFMTAAPTEIPLWPGEPPRALGGEAQDRPRLTVYPAAADNNNGTAVVVCPGGGYRFLSMDFEGHQIAEWFNRIGVTAFVLQYRLPGDGYRHPVPLLDVQQALRLVRSRAAEWRIDADRIGILGFSAGGHLASTAATQFAQPVEPTGDKNAAGDVSVRPDFQILIYPVITMKAELTHAGSRDHLLGRDASNAQLRDLSNESQVDADTPPAFIVHAGDDTVVPVENSIRYYRALNRAGIPAELHLYPSGGHGFGMRPEGGRAAEWPALCESWLKEIHRR